jgi:hypothetical protein
VFCPSDKPAVPSSGATLDGHRTVPVHAGRTLGRGLLRQIVRDADLTADSAAPIRVIFREAFDAAGVPYFNPHSFRNTLVQLGEMLCKSPEEFKAWSQNLGHEGVLTTFYSYGQVGSRRQAEIIRALGASGPAEPSSADASAEAIAEALFRRLEHAGRVG